MPQFLKRLIVTMLFGCVIMAVSAMPSAAVTDHIHLWQAKAADPPNPMVIHDRLCLEANVVRKKVIKQFGKRAPGRDICRYGFSAGVKATKIQQENYLQTLERMIAPPPVIIQSGGDTTGMTTQSSGSYSAVGTVGTGALPACASESGTNYSTGPLNTNPKSGATGRYQIIPSTHASLCAGLGWSPSGQDQCALNIYRAQGASAWVGCGG